MVELLPDLQPMIFSGVILVGPVPSTLTYTGFNPYETKTLRHHIRCDIGNDLFVGFHEQNLIVCLSASDRAMAKSNAKPFVVNGRAMREYVSIGDAGQRKQNEVALLAKSAFGYASGLAPKIKQVAKATTAKSKVNKRD